MARTLGFDPENLSDTSLEVVHEMLERRAQRGEEWFQRECAAHFNPPEPTLADVMRELRDIKRMVQALSKSS